MNLTAFRHPHRLGDNGNVERVVRASGVILAAGLSSRFGSPKQQAVLGDRTMLEHVVAAARASGLAPVIAVVPPGFEPPDGALGVVNDRPAHGLSRSLHLGIGAVPVDAEAAVILLGDQPTVADATIEALIDASAGARPVVATRAEGRIGPPVLLRREAFGLVEQATGDEGLASILARRPDLVAYLDVAAHAPDVDTPEDLEALRQ